MGTLGRYNPKSMSDVMTSDNYSSAPVVLVQLSCNFEHWNENFIDFWLFCEYWVLNCELWNNYNEIFEYERNCSL